MADSNKLNASSEYQLSDVSTEMNTSASLSNNESSGTGRDSLTINSANQPSSTPDLKNVQDLTRYVRIV